jgi:hypothetical protein
MFLNVGGVHIERALLGGRLYILFEVLGDLSAFAALSAAISRPQFFDSSMRRGVDSRSG